jgi:hypothetical protein
MEPRNPYGYPLNNDADYEMSYQDYEEQRIVPKRISNNQNSTKI